MSKSLLCLLFFFTFTIQESYMDSTIHSPMYTSYASKYDLFYSSKNYAKEVEFLSQLLKQHPIKKILDVGCGTGTHMALLENKGYTCTGIDLNQPMLSIAKTKVNGPLFQLDMCSFNLPNTFDAVICMFAVFNHNLSDCQALQTLQSIKKHLIPHGLVVLDLYNPQSSGKKVETRSTITRTMQWELDTTKNVCSSSVQFSSADTFCESQFILKIYQMHSIQNLLEEAGFTDINFYENYSFKKGSDQSKNLIVTAYAQ